VDLFYSPTNTGAPDTLTPIPGAQNLNAGSESFSWTSGMPSTGTFFVIARIADGLNVTQRVSSAPFVVVPPQGPGLNCSPRPEVKVQSTPSGDGRLRVTVTATGQSNSLSAIRFDSTVDALIDIPNGQQGSRGNFSQPVLGNVATYSFFIRRETAGQAATARFRVVDGCGEWQTFAGGGANAGF